MGCAADGASNMQRMLKQVSATERTVPIQCFAHTGELLCKDVLSLFPDAVKRGCAVEHFFRMHHWPRVLYLEEMERQSGTLLRKPVSTRWGSTVMMLRSIVNNRDTVESVLGRLRREKYTEDDFKSLRWIWEDVYWGEWEQLLRIAEPELCFFLSVLSEFPLSGGLM